METDVQSIDIENLTSDWDKLCRICLTDQAILFPVFGIEELDEQYNMSFCDLLNNCSGLNVTLNDNFPQLICSLCITHLHSALEFRIKCQTAEDILTQLVQEKDDSDNDVKYEIVEINADDSVNIENHEDEDFETTNTGDTDLGKVEDCLPLPLDIIVADTLNDDLVNPVVSKKTVKRNKKIKKDTLIKVHTCQICHTSCNSYKELAAHKKMHSNTCSKCNIRLKTKEEYIEHLKQHRRKEKCLCTTCGKKFVNSSALNIHLRTHTKEKRYECNFCGKKFLHWNNRRYHIRNHHTLEKPFVCEICNFRFAHKTHLVGHMETHSDERPFSCTMCVSKFKRKSTLNMHMLKHTGEVTAICEICDKGFYSNSKLKIHMVTHTGLKEHICTVCDKAFTQPYELRYHMKKHLDTKPKPSE